MLSSKEKLVEVLSKYFDIGDSYAYNLTRVKSAFACGTMGFDDFEEFDEETVTDIADHLIAHGVTVQQPQKPIEHKVDVTAIVVGNAHWCKGTTLYKCPKCGSFISRIYDYCLKCGQAFDWSDLPQAPKGEQPK